MAGHQVTIASFDTRLDALAAPGREAELGHRMRQALEGPVPRAFREVLEQSLADREGVIRIRRLDMTLTQLGGLDPAALAAGMAGQLRQALARMLRQPRPHEVMIWPDHADYAADYLVRRLLGQTPPGWAFPDFRALAHLGAGQAALELIGARPDILRALARRLPVDAGGAAGPLPSGLDDSAALALVARLLRGSATPGAPMPGRLAAAVGMLQAAGAPTSEAPGRAALGLTLRLIRGGAETRPVAAVGLAASAVALALAARARPGLPLPLSRLIAPGTPPETAPWAALPPPLRDTLAGLAGDPAWRAELAAAERRVRQRPVATARPPARPSAAAEATRAAAAGPVLLHSGVAGGGLLIGMMADLTDTGGPDAAHYPDILAAVLDDEAAPRDPLLAALAPLPRISPPPLAAPGPDRIERLPEPCRALAGGRPGAAGWADLLLAQLAARLPGLSGSSRAYLQRQFLAVPGTLRLSPDIAELVLDGPDLSIVLRMAGFAGPQRRLPHLQDRLFVLGLNGGHR